MNNTISIILFIIAMTIAAGLYTFANFKETTGKIDKGIVSIVLISIGYAILEYAIKAPSNYYIRNVLPPIVIHMVWLIITTVLVIIFQVYYLKNKIKPRTYVSIVILISILFVELYY